MAAVMNTRANTQSPHSPPPQELRGREIPALVLDIDEDDNDDMGDGFSETSMEEPEHYARGGHAQTVFHQPRSDNDTMNSTRSLYDTDVVYHYLHGRRYCGDYFMPNDEEEQTRLQILHGVYQYLFQNRLTTVPLQNPQKILDIGTGTGEWAMAMGDEYPDAEIIGTDIARIQPSAVPLNVFFEIDDAEEEGGWTYADDEFDLIHFRSMVGAFADWSHIYREAYKHLKPGGWIEVVDFDDHKDLLNYFEPNSGILEITREVRKASLESGYPKCSAHLAEPALTSLGFVDVRSTDYILPIGTWPSDPEVLRVAKHFLVAQLCGVEATCLRPLTEQLGWDVDKVREACEKVTESMRTVATDMEKAQGMSFKVKVLVGRKPGAPDIGPAGRGRWLSPADCEDDDDDGESVNTMTNVNGAIVNGNQPI